MKTFEQTIDLHHPIAIIGMGCLLPGARNTSEHWQNILDGQHFIKPVSGGDIPIFYDPDPKAWNKTNSNLGAQVENFVFPQNEFVGLPPLTAQAMDEWSRRSLWVAKQALEDAKISRDSKYGQRTFVALATNGFECETRAKYSEATLYRRLGRLRDTPTFKELSPEVQDQLIIQISEEYFKADEKLNLDEIVNSTAAGVAGRIAKLYRFKGGHTSVDAACASSFGALDIAIRKLRNQTSDLAVVGGLGRLSPFLYVYCSKAQTMSSKGSFPFDVRASGFVGGEGCTFFVLKRLQSALQDNDQIHAVIRGIAPSSDGSETGPWAPNKDGQKLAVKRALAQTGYSLNDLQYIECHGTGTQVGDVEELTGIRELLNDQNLAGKNKYVVGSAKASVGHLLTGAGMAGLVRTVLAIKNKTLPATANIEKLIPDLDDSPFRVLTKPEAWTLPADKSVRRAMVNCFGFGGTNYNLQLEEFLTSYHSSYGRSDGKSFNYNYLAKKPLKDILLSDANSTYNVPIAIVGVGLALPGTNSLIEFSQNLQSGKTFITDMPADRWEREVTHLEGQKKWTTVTLKGGFMDLPSFKEKLKWKIPPVVLDHIDPNQFRLFKVVDEALTQSGLKIRKQVLENTAMICGTMQESDFMMKEEASLRFNYLQNYFETKLTRLNIEQRKNLASEFFERIKADFSTFNGDNSTSGVDSMLGARVAKFFDMKGGALSFDSACATGGVSVDFACAGLRSRQTDAVVVCSSNMAMSGPLFCMYNDLGLLSPTGQVKPFDKNRNGCVVGEGAVALVLRRLDDAVHDGANILALIHGTSLSSDGSSNQMLRPVKETMDLVLKQAQHETNSEAPVEYVECQGLGVETSDLVEMQSIFEQYGKNSPVVIGSSKASYGQLRVASGFMSIAKVALSLKNKTLYPTPGFEEPDDFLLSTEGRLSVLKSSQQFRSQTPFAAVNMLGVSGINAHIVLSHFDVKDWTRKKVQIERQSLENSKTALFSYNSDQERSAKLKQLKTFASQNVFQEDLLRKHGLFVLDPDVLNNKNTALLFAGQSSGYLDMFKDLTQVNETFRQHLKIADERAGLWRQPTFTDILYKNKNEQLLGSLFYSQFISFIFQVAAAKHLGDEFKWQPRLLIGHSIGEFAAAVVSGAYSYEQGLDILYERYLTLERLKLLGIEQGKMAALRATEKTAQSLVAQVPNVYVANVNAPMQTVIAGTAQQLGLALELAAQRGIEFKRIAASHAYHTPLLNKAVEPFANYLRSQKTGPMHTPVTSASFSKVISDPTQLADSLSAAFTRQVRFGELVELAHLIGIRHFVDLGPNWQLHKLTQLNLEPTRSNFRSYYLNHPKENDIKLFEQFKGEWRAIQPQTSLAPCIAGTAFERGLQVGRLYENADYSWLKARLPENFGLQSECARLNFRLYTPKEYQTELQGVAEASHNSLEEVEKLNGSASALTMHYGLCSGFQKFGYHGANYDLPFLSAEDSDKLPRHVLEFRTPDRIPFLGVFKKGSVLPFTGINAAGLSVSYAASSAPHELGKGICANVLVRILLETCSNLEDVKGEIQKYTFESNWNLLIYSRVDQASLLFEISVQRIHTSQNTVYSNHFQNIVDGLPISEDSVLRLKRLQELTNSMQDTPHSAISMLGDKFDLARGRKTKFSTKNTINRYNTGVSVLYDHDLQVARVCCDRIPAGNGPFEEFPFPKPSETKRPTRWVRALQQPVVLEQAIEPPGHETFFLRGATRMDELSISGPYSLAVVCDWTEGEDFLNFDFSPLVQKIDQLRSIFKANGYPKHLALLLPYRRLPDKPTLLASAMRSFALSLAQEQNRMRLNILYSPGEWLATERAGKYLAQILNSVKADTELALAGNILFGIKYVPQVAKSTTPLDCKDKTFLITGGASGITAEIALALAEKYGGRYILLGRTSLSSETQSDIGQIAFIEQMRKAQPGLKPITYKKLWDQRVKQKKLGQNLKRFRDAGVDVTYISHDLVNGVTLNELKIAIKQYGPIHHVIHGAGIQHSKLFLEKSADEFRHVFASKSIGTQNLLKAIDGQPIESLTLFSSIAACNGNIGQTDYAATNGVHAILHDYLPGICLKTIAWPAWDDVGMAVDESVHADMKSRGLSFLSVKDGIDFFMTEFIGQTESASVVCAPDGAESTVPATLYHMAQNPQGFPKLEYVDQIILIDRDKIVARKTFSGREQFLRDHIIRSHPTLPAVVVTEMTLQVAKLFGLPFEKLIFKNITFSNPCTIENGGTTFEIKIERADCDFKFSITSPKKRSDGIILLQQSINAYGELERKPAQRQQKVLAQPVARALRKTDEFYSRLKSVFPEFLGPSYQSLTRLIDKTPTSIHSEGFLKSDHGFGKGHIFFNAAIFDLMNQIMVEYENLGTDEQTFIPFRFSDVEFLNDFRPGQYYQILAENIRHDDEQINFQATFIDMDQNVCLKVGNVTHRKYHRRKINA